MITVVDECMMNSQTVPLCIYQIYFEWHIAHPPHTTTNFAEEFWFPYRICHMHSPFG